MIEERVPFQQRRDLSQIIQAAVNLHLQNFWPLFRSGVFILARLVAGTVSAAANAVLLPFAVTAMTLLYEDLKVQKESDAIW